MLTTALLVIAATALAGLAVKASLDALQSELCVTWAEYAFALVGTSLLLVPTSLWAGYALSVRSQLSYNEYWNGSELAVSVRRTDCSRDGPCKWAYDCDPYRVSYSCNCKDGRCDTCTRTEYHACPYCAFEEAYLVSTTLGGFTFASHRLPDDPHNNRWQPSRRKALPERVIRQAGVGAPADWLQAKARVDAGDFGPVTKVSGYQNFLLASDQTILKQYSDALEKYAELLPAPARSVYGHYFADKLHFQGVTVPNPQDWQDRLARLNARLGSVAQGDLQVVLVAAGRVDNPREYVNALRAHWQSKAHKPWSFAKNGVALVLGVEGSVVKWADGFTGMPEGNASLLSAFRERLPGTKLDAGLLFGRLPSTSSPTKADGLVTDLLFGMSSPSSRFKRVSMTGDDPEDVGTGNLYLRGEIRPTATHRWIIGVVAFVLSMFAWLSVALLGERDHSRR